MNIAGIWSFTAVVLLQTAVGYAQRGPTSLAPNLWMTYPVAWSPANDAVPSAVRQMRDQYMDESIGFGVPLTPANAKSRVYSEGVPFPNQPELPELSNRSIVIGTFVSYQPVLSKSGRAVYTEATFSVSNVFQDASGTVKPGSSIVVILRGGTVQTDAGVVLSYLTQRLSYCVGPGNTYLLAFSFQPNGNFYVIGKDWDLTTGTAKLNSFNGAGVPSTLVGLSIPQLISTLNAHFGIQ
jgi:hypothetical protein